MRFGYACINTELSKQKITTNRTCRLNTLKNTGSNKLLELAIANVDDLQKVLKWNVDNGINFFRISSSLLPWFDRYRWSYEHHHDWDLLLIKLKYVGQFIKQNDIRVSMHPGHFTKLGSFKSVVVENAIADLEMHGFIFDAMELDRSPYYKINIHVGSGAKDKETTAKIFISNFYKLSDSVKSRLTLENDDKSALWSSSDLWDLILSKTGIPLVFDWHHNNIAPDKNNFDYIYNNYIKPNWSNITPVIHYSSSRKTFEDSTAKSVAHADFIYDFDSTYWKQYDVDILLEAKAKEQAVLRYKKEFCKSVRGNAERVYTYI